MPEILLIEDEPQMQLGIKDNLEFEGYTVTVAGDGQSGLDLFLAKHYDLVLLDVMLPRISGFDILKKARQNQIETPVIMLTAKGEEIDRVLGLELGADDYITKPFSLRELLARIKAVLRRVDKGQTSSKSETETVRIGQLQVNFHTCAASSEGVEVRLSHKELQVLQCLWQSAPAVVSREQLLNQVWGYDEMISTRTIDNFIVKLRQRIESDPAHPRIILTVHGTGYKLLI